MVVDTGQLLNPAFQRLELFGTSTRRHLYPIRNSRLRFHAIQSVAGGNLEVICLSLSSRVFWMKLIWGDRLPKTQSVSFTGKVMIDVTIMHSRPSPGLQTTMVNDTVCI